MPDGDGMFGSFDDPVINDAGQIAFSTITTGTAAGAGDDSALFLYDDDLGLVEVARESRDFFGLGGEINTIGFANGQEDEADGLNDSGQVVFRTRRRLASFQEAIVRFTLSVPLPGDLNGDDLINFDDLVPFVTALTDVAAYEAAFPGLYPTSCDIDGDGLCNFADLGPFGALLTTASASSSGAASVPEPCSLSICCAGLCVMLARRRRARVRCV